MTTTTSAPFRATLDTYLFELTALRGLSETTKRSITGKLTRFIGWVADGADTDTYDLRTVTRADFIGWIGWLRETPFQGRPRSASTITHNFYAVTAFFTWAAAAGHLDRDPMAGLNRMAPRAGRREQAAFTVSQLDALRDAAAADKFSSRSLLIFMLLSCCGLRRVEVAGLTMSDLTDDVPGAWVTGKDGTRRWVAFPAPVRSALADYLDDRARILRRKKHRPHATDRLLVVWKMGPHGDTGRRLELSEGQLSIMIRRWVEAAGCYDRHVGLHAFRRTFSTMGVNDRLYDQIQMDRALGHASGLAGRYRKTDRELMARLAEQHPIALRFAPADEDLIE